MASAQTGEGSGTPLQNSCLENPMDGGAWWCSPWGREELAQLSDFTFPFHFHALEKEMATLSSTLAWRIPGTGVPGELLSMGSHRVGHDWSDLAAAAADRKIQILEWVVISFSNAWKWKVKVKSFSRIWLLATPWTAAHQAPPSMGFSRQEYWSGVLLPSPGGNWGRFKPWKTEVNHRATHFSRCLPWGHSSENKPKTSLSLQLGGREWMELEGEEELEGRKSEKGGS